MRLIAALLLAAVLAGCANGGAPDLGAVAGTDTCSIDPAAAAPVSCRDPRLNRPCRAGDLPCAVCFGVKPNASCRLLVQSDGGAGAITCAATCGECSTFDPDHYCVAQ
jgi:hypothetical protein